MRHHRLSWITAAAIAVAPFAPVPAGAAPMPARAVAPADVTTPTVVRHVDTDVDGDGTRDSVTLTYLGSDRFMLSATTTKGRTSTVSFSSVFETMYPYTPRVAWYGASAIDGRKGSELIINLLTKGSVSASSNLSLRVYTWRSGRLVTEKAPASPWGKEWRVRAGDSNQARGYRFFTSHGHRYVDATRMTTNPHGTPWKGTVTRSVWRSGKWVKVSTRRAKTLKDFDQLTWGQVGVAGPKLLLDQLDVDVSGDGLADRVLIYRNGRQSYPAMVSANAHVASRVVTYTADPFIGAAQVEDSAGYELIFNTWTGSDDPEWAVLTWRDGALVDVPGPVENRWWGVAGDDDQTNFALSADGGSHDVLVTRTEWGHYAGNPAHFIRSVWSVDHWSTQAEWDSVLTAEQAAAFQVGFTASDLVTP